MTSKVGTGTPLPLHNHAASTPTMFTLYDKIASIYLFLLTPPFMAMMASFTCVMLTIRGLPLGLVVLTCWEYATDTVPVDAPSFWRTLIDISQISIIGGCVLGTFIGVILSIHYIVTRSLPNGVRKLGPQKVLPYVSSDRKPPPHWQYRGDRPFVVCAGLLIGSVTVPVAYLAMRRFGWEIRHIPSDSTRPALIASLGAVCGTIMEACRERSARAEEETKAAEETTDATNNILMATSTAGGAIADDKTSV